ncbi:hypothetical protein SAMN00790413_04859 [Deinococcus hopiensis KR-140]|uniref:Uncharacterized protein n=1 Tax=Deinococcus hopiensis KR-140 TaxID=695939 RepID=A0A1W1UM25_9DEIO|nr:hypothetical protein SAMN00790413_04859 [Deinococcus hopiensis KR-140]
MTLESAIQQLLSAYVHMVFEVPCDQLRLLLETEKKPGYMS